MSTRRFEVTRVLESNHPNSSIQQVELIPVIHVEHEIPSPPPLPPSITSNNQIFPKKPFDMRRRATIVAAMASIGKPVKICSSAGVIHQFYPAAPLTDEVDDSDAYSTIQSNNTNNNDTNSPRITNKFLQELRSKRRELRAKAKNYSIDQRIAFNRRENQRTIRRAQDVFDVHFELEEKEEHFPTVEYHLFSQESQEKIRKDIYTELDRQRTKEYHKHHRHLLLGRSLLVFMIILLTFMSCTLVYVVSDLYNRARFLDAKLPDNEFVSMVSDKTPNSF